MKKRIQKIALLIFLGSSFYVSAQNSATSMYAEVDLLDNAASVTTSEKLVNEVDKIVKLADELFDSNEKQKKRIKRKIAEHQLKISELKDELEAESIKSKSNEGYLNFPKYAFDIADNSLEINSFNIKRNGTYDSIEINIESQSTGKARIDFISPGGELLETIIESDFNGKLKKMIELNTEPGRIYFVHISIGNLATTKKLKFG